MKNIKTIVLILIFIAVFGALTYFFYYPQTVKIVSLYKDNLNKEKEIKELEERRNNSSSLKKQEEEIKSAMEKMNLFLPEDKMAGRFLVEVEGIASQIGIELNGVKFSEEKVKATASPTPETETSKKTATPSPSPQASPASSTIAGLKTINFEITLVGNFISAVNFLKKMQELDRLNLVESTRLELVGSNLQSIIKGKIFYKGTGQK